MRQLGRKCRKRQKLFYFKQHFGQDLLQTLDIKKDESAAAGFDDQFPAFGGGVFHCDGGSQVFDRGYHAVVVTDFRQPVDAPTADEFELYRAMAIVEANRETIESVTKSLDSDNVKSNKTLRESYNAELNLAKAEITKYLEIAQKYTTDIVDENYKMSDTLKKKIDKWVESVDDVDGSTDPDIEKNTSSLVITSLLNDLLVELDKDNIKFASTFNKDQLRLYINNLIESYNEEK